MRSIILLLCCLALSTAPALTEDVNAAQNYAKVYAGASMLERAHFHSLVAKLLKAANETYRPKESGDVNFQCIQIVMEALSMLPKIGNAFIPEPLAPYLPSNLNYYLRTTMGLQENELDSLKVALDNDYDRMMEKIEQRANEYKESLKASGQNPQKQTLQNLADFYERLSKLKRERREGHTVDDTVFAVLGDFFNNLQTLSELRQLFCNEEEVFDFSRETFTRHFESFIGLLQSIAAKHLLDKSGIQGSAQRFLSYFDGVLDAEIMKKLKSVYADTKFAEALMKLTLAVVFRPEAYFVTVDDFNTYGVKEYFELPYKVVERLNVPDSDKMSLKYNDAAVPGLVRAFKGAGRIERKCTEAANMIAKAVNVNTKRGFDIVTRGFCHWQSYLHHLFLQYIQTLRQRVGTMQVSNGLPNNVAYIGNNILQPGHLYPDNNQNPTEAHPSLLLKKSRWTMVSEVYSNLDLLPTNFPKPFVSKILNFINVTTGSPACRESENQK